ARTDANQEKVRPAVVVRAQRTISQACSLHAPCAAVAKPERRKATSPKVAGSNPVRCMIASHSHFYEPLEKGKPMKRPRPLPRRTLTSAAPSLTARQLFETWAAYKADRADVQLRN